MRLDVTFRNTHAAAALTERAEKKFRKVAKHLRDPIEAHMVFRVEKHRHIAEITVNSAGDVLKAQEETDDMYATIDGLMSKIERMARRHKEKSLNRSVNTARGGNAGA